MAKVAPTVTEVDGIASPSRKQGIQIPQGLAAWIEWTLRDDAGNPANLTGLGFPESSSSGSSAAGGSIKLRVIECLSLSQQNRPIEIEGEAVDPTNGVVKAKLTSKAVEKPGVYIVEWSVYSPDGDLEHVTQGSMIVNRTLAGGAQAIGPPTLQEIRLHLRDSGPEDNYLLDTVENDLAEVAACIERAVQVWNETLIFVPKRYTTVNFPYRSQWLDAICGYLFTLAAHNYDRNLQAYTAGGTSMQDKNKGPGYMQKGMGLIQQYKDWVKQRKGQINLESAFGGTSERY
jgi:hypothetical protein